VSIGSTVTSSAPRGRDAPSRSTSFPLLHASFLPSRRLKWKNMSSRPSSKRSANQFQPTCSAERARVLHSRSIQLSPRTSNFSPSAVTVPDVGIRMRE
jgi:hypothetical protein